MFDALRRYLERSITLSDEEFDILKTAFMPRHYPKGSFLQRAGDIARYGGFVAKGCMRSYTVDDKGKEHIVQFAPENWWISDLNNSLIGEPTGYFIDAIEDSDLLVCDLPSFEKALTALPTFAEHYRLGMQKHMVAKNRRISAFLSATAEERYLDFLKTYPSIARRVPQHMLASYLGITPETLSRVRKQLSRK
ncbi:Crp/Fnr family transcriptional regulator [Larkinella soli]|uniref:Crp/Fnr family transcriptional regulator n=1 Tax=Larkinella soli TaxID=1770527 RepID=UPI000FFC88EA|nr:Crp/Fnr family transcriptional regulator [Larkinella soli]